MVRVATDLFTEHGYEGTSIEAILAGSGVSRGALYHHFSGKPDLFEAVFHSVEEDIGLQLQAAATAADPVTSLRGACLAWVHLAGDPVVQRIVLLDAPAVLGWRQWRHWEERYALGLLKHLLGAIADDSGLAVEFIDMFAHVLLASLNEIALVIAGAPDTKAALRSAERAVDELLTRLVA